MFYALKDEQIPTFIIKFADQDISDIIIFDDEECAINAFTKYSQNWTCYLFELKEIK